MPRPKDTLEQLPAAEPLPDGILAAGEIQTLTPLIGKEVVVEGIVTDSAWSRSGKVMNIRFASVEENQTGLFACIFLKDRAAFDGAFGGDAAGAFLGARLRLHGALSHYGGFDLALKGAPEMILTDPKQVTIVEQHPAHGELPVPLSTFGKQSHETETAFNQAKLDLDKAARLRSEGKQAEAATLAREAVEKLHAQIAQYETVADPKRSDNLSVASALEGLSFRLRELGSLPEAESTAREALAICRKLLGNEHADVAQALHLLAWNLNMQGKHAEAEAFSREELAIWRKLLGDDDPNVAWALGDLTIFLRDQKKLPEAETTIRESLAIRHKRLGNTHPDTVNSFNLLIDLLRSQGKLAEAEVVCRKELALETKPSGLGDLNPARLLHLLADILYDQGKWAEAEAPCREAIALFGQSAQDNPTRSDSAIDLGHTQWRLADMLTKTGRRDQAEGILREAIKVFEKAARGFPAQPYLRQEEGYSTWMLAEMLEGGGRLDAAEAEYRQAIALHQKAGAAFPNEAVFTERLGTLKVRLVEMVHWRGIMAEAKSMYREAAEHGGAPEFNEYAWFLATSLTQMCGTEPMPSRSQKKRLRQPTGNRPVTWTRWPLRMRRPASSRRRSAFSRRRSALSQNDEEKKDLASQLKLYENKSPYRDHGPTWPVTDQRPALLEGKFAEAEAMARECLAIRERDIPDDWRTFNARSMLGGSLLGQKKYAEAEPLLLSGYEGMKQREVNIPLEGKVRLSETLQRLVQLYEATNRPDQAAEWKQKLKLFSGEEAERTAAAKP